MPYDHFNYEGTGVSRQRYRMLRERLWSDLIHTSLLCTFIPVMVILFVVGAIAKSSGGYSIWMFGVNSKQSVEIHEVVPLNKRPREAN